VQESVLDKAELLWLSSSQLVPRGWTYLFATSSLLSVECDDPTEDLIAPKSSRIGTEMFSYDIWLIKEANAFGFVTISTFGLYCISQDLSHWKSFRLACRSHLGMKSVRRDSELPLMLKLLNHNSKTSACASDEAAQMVCKQGRSCNVLC